MPKIVYASTNFRRAALECIDQMNYIIDEYTAQGFSLTVRQLYYQLVARGLIPNRQSEYKKIVRILSKAREAGLVDWSAIEDRTRGLRGRIRFDSPTAALNDTIRQYGIDKWHDQEYRIEVWVEKDALIGVIAQVCNRLDLNYFSCRGYPSASEVWKAGQRVRYYEDNGQDVYILHLGDHDPSGIDMTRDIKDRAWLYSHYSSVIVDRIALNMNQIEELRPPPNPVKLTDSRSDPYIAKYGHESWELDALDPATLAEIIERAVRIYRDDDKWAMANKREATEKQQLKDLIAQLGK